MKLFGYEVRREVRDSVENPSVPVSADNFMSFFGVESGNLPHVTIDNAMTVPAVEAAVLFLSRTLASLPLHAYRYTDSGPVRMTGKTAVVLEDYPNDEMDTSKFRRYFWEQVFTGGRGLAWIERNGNAVEALWPMQPEKTSVKRVGQKLVYTFEGRQYSADEVIDLPFMLKSNMVGHRGPIAMARKAIQLALAMNDYASGFFAGGGIPPMVLEGPMPANAEAMRRARSDISRAIEAARQDRRPIFQIPPGYKLNPVGFDPEKGQVTAGRLFQIQEFSRVWQIPPNFLHDLSKATFSNVEQNDIYLVKHLISQWAIALEGEMNLKVFGRMNSRRYVRHNLDALLRGDFLSRLNGIARGIQSGVLTPNEGRALENRPKHSNPAADELYVQGATVPLGTISTNSTGRQTDEEGSGNGDQG